MRPPETQAEAGERMAGEVAAGRRPRHYPDYLFCECEQCTRSNPPLGGNDAGTGAGTPEAAPGQAADGSAAPDPQDT